MSSTSKTLSASAVTAAMLHRALRELQSAPADHLALVTVSEGSNELATWATSNQVELARARAQVICIPLELSDFDRIERAGFHAARSQLGEWFRRACSLRVEKNKSASFSHVTYQPAAWNREPLPRHAPHAKHHLYRAPWAFRDLSCRRPSLGRLHLARMQRPAPAPPDKRATLCKYLMRTDPRSGTPCHPPIGTACRPLGARRPPDSPVVQYSDKPTSTQRKALED